MKIPEFTPLQVLAIGIGIFLIVGAIELIVKGGL
jgi:hypothetical protein